MTLVYLPPQRLFRPCSKRISRQLHLSTHWRFFCLFSLGELTPTFVPSKEAISLSKHHFYWLVSFKRSGHLADRLLCGAVSCCFLCCHCWMLSFAKTNSSLARMLTKEWDVPLTCLLLLRSPIKPWQLIWWCIAIIYYRREKQDCTCFYYCCLALCRKAVYSGMVAFVLAVVTFPESIGSYMASQVGFK